MEYPSICVECQNFEEGDNCPFFKEIPFAIKNREIKCKYFSGGDYFLYGKDAYKNG